MSVCKQDWYDYEKNLELLLTSLKDHSEFEIIDGQNLKGFMAENLVMNYNNIEYQKQLFGNYLGGS